MGDAMNGSKIPNNTSVLRRGHELADVNEIRAHGTM
jgi:hypothetical protein